MLLHTHKYKRVSSDVPDYFECECGDQIDESQVIEYYEYLQGDIEEQFITGN